MDTNDTQEHLCPWRWKSGTHWLWTGTNWMKLHPRLSLCAMSQWLAGGSTLSWAAAPGCRGPKLGWLQCTLTTLSLLTSHEMIICVNLRVCMIFKTCSWFRILMACFWVCVQAPLLSTWGWVIILIVSECFCVSYLSLSVTSKVKWFSYMAAYISNLSLPALLLLGIHLYFLTEDSVFVATFP